MGDESFYELALLEYDAEEADKALLAKAFVKANGDEGKVKIEYIKLRVAQLKGGPMTRLRRLML